MATIVLMPRRLSIHIDWVVCMHIASFARIVHWLTPFRIDALSLTERLCCPGSMLADILSFTPPLPRTWQHRSTFLAYYRLIRSENDGAAMTVIQTVALLVTKSGTEGIARPAAYVVLILMEGRPTRARTLRATRSVSKRPLMSWTIL